MHFIPPTYALGQCLRHRYSPDNYRGARGRRASVVTLQLEKAEGLLHD